MTAICDALVNEGVCHRSNCSLSHEVLPCTTCKMVFFDGPSYEAHIRSALHDRRANQHSRRKAGVITTVLCTVCDAEITSPRLYSQHANGRQHVQKLAAKGFTQSTDPGPEEVEVPKNCTRCDICFCNVPNFLWNRHLKGSRHEQALRFNSLKGALDESERNKNGVVIEKFDDAIDFGFIEYSRQVPLVRILQVQVKNTNTTPVYIVDSRLTSEVTNRASYSHFKHDHVGRTKINPGAILPLTLIFEGKSERGAFEDRLELVFLDPIVNRRFSITRSIHATVGIKADYDALKASAPYVRPKRREETKITAYTPGVPPESIAEIAWKVKLDFYKAPTRLVDVAFGAGSPTEIAAKIKSAFLPAKFVNTTHGRHFSTLLWIEEERARRDLQLYDVHGATLSKDPRYPKYFELQVDGLAEKRPSVIVTDRIIVKEDDSSNSHAFEGHVHIVKEKSVLLQFHSRFQSIRGQKFFVRFDLNRLVYRRMHQALGTAFNSNRVLFPHADHLQDLSQPSSQRIEAIRAFDRKIEKNPPQMLAVAAILSRPRGSIPFIVFGPPGTGKTVTIIEAIRQVLHVNPKAHILACAPSNSAADLIVERLAILGKNQLLRLNAPSRSKRTVPKNVLQFSLLNSSDIFCAPSVDALTQFRVVVSTCLSASIPYGMGVKRGHFTHIFIDEAGQATEPEVMVPIKDNADSETNVILSGDSKQLGPIVRSPVARELGLGVSYLDRLMQNPVYDERDGKGTTIVKLTKNWRSHPAILKFPNEEFYGSDLEACGDPAVTESLLRWDGLVKARFPVIFHGISGKDEREASSPSFFNAAEASLVKSYVEDLFDDRRLRLTSEHIGIISPYHAQVCKIRSVLPRAGKEIKVGSVEEYQGQERRVIIISTVRSSMDYVSFDLRHTLGFVANPRRFNVAITRAQALLIIVGDPQVLSLDPLWKAFLNYVYLQGGCKGKAIDWDPHEPVDRRGDTSSSTRRREGLSELDALIARTKEEIIDVTEDMSGLALDDVEGNVDQPWREDD